MVDCNSYPTMMETRIQFGKASPKALVIVTEYRSVVETLRYLVHTRSDLAHSVGGAT
jgi:hypothetical protein